ncbi:HamA C-terminal domain-containing protein [Sphingobacterium bovistauri]|uniref:DUF1837 domain-containing protein n=1 Tax=Sphingobacterium bovistauri TaxID=2781959 RepID=A0ABS7ZBP1_9SPHI|nr:DUF1837 domain-containing protein [Sphingobacterium bovistauri]MCA5006134.1 DUF1837 domain-containing protein [Sphingobacterium bovistauri]
MKFEVIVNDFFENLKQDMTLTQTNNKRVVGILNDYEDGKWRYDKFQKFIWDNIKETALSHNERKALLSDGESSILTEAAKKLRLVEATDAIGRGSEIAEIVLYGIMKHHYQALPIVPKIFYKQNKKDEAKGSDSVHIVIESPESFSLWFGESKFYNSIENARLDTIVESVKVSLSLDKIKKENSIITNLSDINDFDEINESLRESIKNYLSQDVSIDKIKPLLNIPILLLYECEETKNETIYSNDYKQKMIDYHKERATEYFKKQINKCNDVHLYDEIKFHIVLFPIADKKTIVDKFIQIAQVYRN